ncbi:MAG: DUF6465 family protein [bacterium]|nr:DUF6465 family protein [bacterium]
MARKTSKTGTEAVAKVKETAAAVKADAKKTADVVKEQAKEKAAEAKELVEEVKETVKKTAKAVKKSAKVNVYVQYAGKELSVESIAEQAKAAYVAAGNEEADIKTLDVYVKPEENAAYFAVNGVGSEDFKVEL